VLFFICQVLLYFDAGMRRRLFLPDSQASTQAHTVDKLVGVYISAPRPNFVAMATRVGPEVQWIADFLQARAEPGA